MPDCKLFVPIDFHVKILHMIQTAEDLKYEAHMEETARKIAAEPVPPNSKAAAEAISIKVQFTFHRRFAFHSLTFNSIEWSNAFSHQ